MHSVESGLFSIVKISYLDGNLQLPLPERDEKKLVKIRGKQAFTTHYLYNAFRFDMSWMSFTKCAIMFHLRKIKWRCPFQVLSLFHSISSAPSV